MEPVTIRIFMSPLEAAVAQSFLEGNEIEVFLADENANRIYGAYSVLIGGIRLQVPEEDAELALALLADTRLVPRSTEEEE